MGGMHLVIELEGEIVSHASVVERDLHTGDHRLSTGHVEGVATVPAYQHRIWRCSQDRRPYDSSLHGGRVVLEAA